MRCTAEPLTKKAPYKGLGADSEEKREPVGDIDTAAMDSLKVLDPERPIREADINCRNCDVRFVPSNGLMHRSKLHLYSITWLARTRKAGGKVNPIAFAVFRLTTSSNVVGCSTGMSAGFVPFKILSTISAARRYLSGKRSP
jgi:hypothetical protein